MTVNEAKQKVETLKEIAGDDEAAHGFEDNLRDDFIRYAATEKGKVGRIARIILTTSKIDFCRWCA